MGIATIPFAGLILRVGGDIVCFDRLGVMTVHDCYMLQMKLRGEADRMLNDIGLTPSDAYRQMLEEPELLRYWWEGVHEQSEADEALIIAAARLFAAGAPLPEMTVPQRTRLAFRLRLGSMFVRAISSRERGRGKGWFANKLRRMSERELVEWILLDGWYLSWEVFDEAMRWADEVAHPIAPSTRRPSHTSSSSDGSSLVE
jgi:uncharacterized protein YjiS (DUF1127 family)